MTSDLRNLIGARLDVRKYLQAHNKVVTKVAAEADGRMKYVLSECPFDPSHKGQDAAVFQDPDGKLGFHCFHHSCSEYRWADARQVIGPIRMEHMINGGTNRISGMLPATPFSRRQDTGKLFDLEVMTNDALLDDTTELRFLIQDVLVAEQPCTLGGASKTLKTSLAVDMAVSVASQTPWLGRFDVLEKGGVFIVSAESGKPVLRDQMKAVCESKGLDGRGLPISWSFRRPQLANVAHLNVLQKTLEEVKPKLVLLDPSYLLISGAGSDSTKNLFAMGEVLGGIADAIAESCGGTLILLHHVNKGASRTVKGVMPLISLGDLAYAGFVEWTRQWLLLSRLVPYAEGSGCHELHLSAGGSAGHSGSWAMEINEGRPMDKTTGRKWAVNVSSVASWAENQQAKTQKDDFGRIFACLPGTLKEIVTKSGLKQAQVKKIIEELLNANQIVSSTMPGIGETFRKVEMGDETGKEYGRATGTSGEGREGLGLVERSQSAC